MQLVIWLAKDYNTEEEEFAALSKIGSDIINRYPNMDAEVEER